MDKNQALAILHEYTGKLALPRKEHDVLLKAIQVLAEAIRPAPVLAEVSTKTEEVKTT